MHAFNRHTCLLLLTTLALFCFFIPSHVNAEDSNTIPSPLPVCSDANRYGERYRESIDHTCDAIRAAHKGRASRTVSITLEKESPLPADFVRMLLTTPDTLPATATGGLILRGGIIHGTLSLRNAVIPFPVALDSVRFLSRFGQSVAETKSLIIQYSRFLGRFSVLNSIIASGPLSIDQSTFADDLFIKNTTFNVRSADALSLTESRIEGDLEVFDSVVVACSTRAAIDSRYGAGYLPPSPRPAENRCQRHALIIDTNTVNGNAFLTQNTVIGNVSISFNEVRRLDIGGQFNYGFRVIGNDARYLRIVPHAQSDLDFQIARNTTKTDLIVVSQAGLHRYGEARVIIADNVIGGLLGLRNTSLNPPERSYVDAAELLGDVFIDINGNAVAGDLKIDIPSWRIQVQSMEIVMEGSSVGDETTIIQHACDGTLPPVSVDLANLQTGRLSWDIPAEQRCNVTWRADNLRFNDWIVRPDIRNGGSLASSLEKWIALDQSVNSQETLLRIGEYLLSRGYNETGRDVLADARRQSFKAQWSESGIIDIFIYGYLYPTGYGAKPERALVILFFVWLAGLCVYFPYTYLYERMFGCWDENAHGASEIKGFNQFEESKLPHSFSIVAFSTDASLPFINLHAYSAFYPVSWFPRFISFAQHFLGWWMLTSFLAAAAILGR